MKKKTLLRIALWTTGGIAAVFAGRFLVNMIGKNIHGTIGIKEKKEDDEER